MADHVLAVTSPHRWPGRHAEWLLACFHPEWDWDLLVLVVGKTQKEQPKCRQLHNGGAGLLLAETARGWKF